MLKECDEFVIPIESPYGLVELNVYPYTSKDKMYMEDMPYVGESAYHLLEGARYQYEFIGNGGRLFQFAESTDIISFAPGDRHRNMGIIQTGIYVGILQLPVCELESGKEVVKILLEIRSVKTDYETDYRQMLDDIAVYYTDLVLMQGSPVLQHLEVDNDCPATTLYQKYSFVRSIVDSDAFREAIHKIMLNPVRKWTETIIEKNIIGVRHLSRKNLRQLVSATNRMPLTQAMCNAIPGGLTHVPRHLDVDYKRDTIDNQENQFVKFALRTFYLFCVELRAKRNASDRLLAEVERTLNSITSYLETSFFRQISMPSHLNMNSPVLQRREGYREVLQAWLMFDLAAKLNWTGGDNVYEAGKKNVATLYEYWLFFKLQELVGEFFHISLTDKAKMVKMDEDGINLNVKQGRMNVLRGKSVSSMRELNVSFYYNRTFSKVPNDQNPIHKAGSWTMPMRPDYTLSIWAGTITEEEAEQQELIVHIHFDAKYRLNRIVLDDDTAGQNIDLLSKELTEEKHEQEMGVYKRADLLKMHAYKDAIRRTSGAYVLYPGTENKELKGFHEIIPGLGAFSIRPGHWSEDSYYLKVFLSEVKAHMLDRASNREKLSFYQYDVHREPEHNVVMESMPEPIGENRNFLPDQTKVLVGYYKSSEHLAWILSERMYNVRAGYSNGAIVLDDNFVNARYLLLHHNHKPIHFVRIKKNSLKVFTRDQLRKKGYPPYLKKYKAKIKR